MVKTARLWKALALVLASLISLGATPDTKVLSDIKLENKDFDVIDFEYANHIFNLNLEFFSQTDSYESVFIENQVINLSQSIFKFAEKNNLPIRECRRNLSLEIYDIEFNLLNDKTRFTGWESNQPEATKIQGLYLPLIDKESKVSGIFLTERVGIEKELLLGHELAHYWYDRLCWSRHWIGGTEDFANKFERFYLKTRG